MSRGGSSPRVRGTLLHPRLRSFPCRFIPACAGNAAHDAAARLAIAGSSPRVRGTRVVDRLLEQIRRFIPACAGNAASPHRRWQPGSVHPRVCGERGIGSHGHRPRRGSSPRVRGTLFAYTADLKRQKWVQEIYRANHVFSKNTTSMVPEDETTPAEVHRSPPACGGSVRRWQDRIQIRCWPPMS